MQKLTATYRIITPMFISGADQNEAELRVPSIKGALRFWWRALKWSSCLENANGEEQTALDNLYEQESACWGSSDDSLNGQSSVLLKLESNFKPQIAPKGQIYKQLAPTNSRNQNEMAGARYLAYGLIVPYSSRKQGTKAGELLRPALIENQKFTVTLCSHKKIDESILNAVKILGLLGGLGSRSRHGFGSVMLESIYDLNSNKKIWTVPATKKEYKEEVKKLLENCSASTLPPFSAFSNHSRVDILLKNDNAFNVLNDFGLKLLDYRSWGQSKRNNILPSGKQSEKRFREDHDWYKSTNRALDFPDFHPERVVFGLPHNYSKWPEDHVKPATFGRRASPLLFHVQKIGNSYLGVSTFLKSLFLPEGEQINVGGNLVDQNIDWSVLTNFISGNEGNPSNGSKRFPNLCEVFPNHD